MPLPRGDEYIAAVQNPRTAFGDAELRDSSPESDQFGIPKPYSGGFTATFHLTNQSREWAVRCFTRTVSDLQQRYAAIDHFLARNDEPFFVGTFYLSQGIRIAAQWFPIIKMQWVKGETLNAFIARHFGDAGRIKRLIPEFLALVQRLQRLKIAHGDLQHGNILVKDGKLVLIDYDGMFLPKLARLRANEIGHPNYQHPGRNAGHYDATIDRFSSIVIYLGLRAISESPKLWARFDDGENILFHAEDFVDLARSAVLRELSAVPGLSSDVDKFRAVCRLPVPDIPDLEAFIAGRFRYPEGAAPHVAAAPAVQNAAPPAAPAGQKPLLDGSSADLLRKHVGQPVDVVGSVVTCHVSGGRFGRPLVLLNFGAYPDQTFTLVLRAPAIKAFHRSGVDPQRLVGQRIKVSGVLASYQGKPQMEVEAPAQIQVLGGGMAAPPLVGASAPVSRPRQEAGGSPESVFDRLYAGRTGSAAPVKAPPAPAKAPAARAPAQKPKKAPPARAAAPRSSRTAPRTAPRQDPRAGRAPRKAPGILAVLVFLIVLTGVAWAIWALVSFNGGW